MADKPKVESPHRKAGRIVLALAVTFGVLLVLATAVATFRPRKITVTTYFADSEGMKPGAAVTLNGVDIGTVKRVTLTSGPEHKKAPVQVIMRLDSRYQPGLHTDSLATLVNLGALADTSVDIDSEQASGPPLEDGDELKTIYAPSVLDLKAGQDTVKAINQTMSKFNTVVDQMETGKGTLGQFITNPSLPKDTAATLDKFGKAAAKLGSTNNTAGKLINDRSIEEKFASIGKDTQGLGASASKLANGPLQGNLATAGKRSNALIADLNAGKGGAGMMLNNPTFHKQLSDTAAQANTLISGYSKNPATGGNFAPGGATTIDLKNFQAATSACATAMRQNPKKFFSIQVRLF
jgi:phospholipid/cholesterol/gamma-HCH transport system substrate-binding protein